MSTTPDISRHLANEFRIATVKRSFVEKARVAAAFAAEWVLIITGYDFES